ncbi:MAG: DNA-binding response regulator [Candidatus Campbellbacteria bacterium]
MRILIVEDEQKLAETLAQGLERKGYASDIIEDGEKALTRILMHRDDYDLIILDLMLPTLDGREICRQVREQNITVPILVLTARNETENKVDLLESGADDYLVKPFSFSELLARVQALLRRPTTMLPVTLRFADIELDVAQHTVTRDGKPVPLTLKEFTLLEYFMRNPDTVINREDILSHLWDFNYESFSNVVDVHVKNLRHKLNAGGRPNLLETVRGVGYRLRE